MAKDRLNLASFRKVKRTGLKLAASPGNQISNLKATANSPLKLPSLEILQNLKNKTLRKWIETVLTGKADLIFSYLTSVHNKDRFL